jgi:hypothetical protein
MKHQPRLPEPPGSEQWRVLLILFFSGMCIPFKPLKSYQLAAGVLASRAGFSNINRRIGKYSRYTNGSDLEHMQ